MSLFLLQLSFAYNPAFYFNMRKSYEDVHHSPPHVSVITGNILITIIRFTRHHLLASNSTFMTDGLFYVLQICQNLNEHYYYLISTIFVIWQIDASSSPFHSLNMLLFKITLERLKLI